MAGKIFINYRRGDDPGYTGWLRQLLQDAFSADQLFMDIDSIAPGLDFVRVLEEEVDKCDVFLAMIGPRWIEARNDKGERRLDNPEDFVRLEIESALKLGKRIIPVLVGNADIPRVEHLPQSLTPLTRRNAVRLTHERFTADAKGLIKQLAMALEQVNTARVAKTAAEAKRQAQEEALRTAELARQQQERVRLHTLGTLSPEQIIKAEELMIGTTSKSGRARRNFAITWRASRKECRRASLARNWRTSSGTVLGPHRILPP